MNATEALRKPSAKTIVSLVTASLFLLSVAGITVIHLYATQAALKTLIADQQSALVARVADDLDQKLQT